MTKEEVEARVRKMATELFGEDAGKLAGDKPMFDTHQNGRTLRGELDSLDQIEFVMALEEEFGVDIPDSAADHTMTMDGTVSFIHGLLSNGSNGEA